MILFCLNKSLHKLQVLQNPAAWIITCTCSPAASLAARRLTRIIVSDLYNNLAPAYMSDLLHTAAPLGLHSAVTSCSLCPSHHYGNRAFSCSAHRNSLPPDIRNAGSLPLFKSKPQIHLFKLNRSLNKCCFYPFTVLLLSFMLCTVTLGFRKITFSVLSLSHTKTHFFEKNNKV